MHHLRTAWVWPELNGSLKTLHLNISTGMSIKTSFQKLWQAEVNAKQLSTALLFLYEEEWKRRKLSPPLLVVRSIFTVSTVKWFSAINHLRRFMICLQSG